MRTEPIIRLTCSPYILCDTRFVRKSNNLGVDAVLAISPGDKDAVQSKVVALIELSRFEEAVDAIDSSNAAGDFDFEKVCPA